MNGAEDNHGDYNGGGCGNNGGCNDGRMMVAIIRKVTRMRGGPSD